MNQRLSFPVSIVPYDPVIAVVTIGGTPSGQWDYEIIFFNWSFVFQGNPLLATYNCYP